MRQDYFFGAIEAEPVVSAIRITPLPSTVTSCAPASLAARIARAMSACVTLAGRRGIVLLPSSFEVQRRPRAVSLRLAPTIFRQGLTCAQHASREENLRRTMRGFGAEELKQRARLLSRRPTHIPDQIAKSSASKAAWGAIPGLDHSRIQEHLKAELGGDLSLEPIVDVGAGHCVKCGDEISEGRRQRSPNLSNPYKPSACMTRLNP